MTNVWNITITESENDSLIKMTNVWNITITESENGTSIDSLNYQYALKHYVYISYLSVLSFLGVFGNVIVICVYIFQRKPSAHKTITVSLAVSDLLVCGAVIPTEVVEKMFHFSLFSGFTCKVWITLSYFAITLSAFMLISLSMDRYRRVCSPLKTQLTPNMAAIFVFITTLSAAAVASPNTLIWNNRKFTLHINRTVHVCVTDTAKHSTDLPTIYNSVLLVLSVSMVVYLVITYTCILKSLISHSRFIKKYKTTNRRPSDRLQKTCTSTTKDNERSVRITIIAFTIVIVFVVSFLPNTAMKLLDTRLQWDVYDIDTTNNHVLRIIARSSCYLNHIANAFIYTLMDSRFRNDCKRFLHLVWNKICKKK